MRQVPRLALWVLLAIVIGLTYSAVITELVRDWIRDDNYSHGFLIPVVSLYILWETRNYFRQPLSPSNWGLLGILASAALFVLGAAGSEVFTQRVSLLGLLASIVLFLGGWRRLGLAGFPIAFMLFAIPLPYVIYYELTAPMQAFAAKVAVAGLQVLGVPTVAEGNMIHLPETSLEVAEACSGIRSLYAFLALGAIVARSTPGPMWSRILIFAATIPLSVAGNAVRVLGTGLGAHLIGPEAAEGTVHEMFGLFVFAVSLIVFILIRKVLGKLWSPVPSSPY